MFFHKRQGGEKSAALLQGRIFHGKRRHEFQTRLRAVEPWQLGVVCTDLQDAKGHGVRMETLSTGSRHNSAWQHHGVSRQRRRKLGSSDEKAQKRQCGQHFLSAASPEDQRKVRGRQRQGCCVNHSVASDFAQRHSCLRGTGQNYR